MKGSRYVVSSAVSLGSQDPGIMARRYFVPRTEEVKLLSGEHGSAELWKELFMWLQEKRWYKVRAFRKGREKTNPANLACVCLHACIHMQASLWI